MPRLRGFVPRPDARSAVTLRPLPDTIVLVVAESAAHEAIRRDLGAAQIVVHYCDPSVAWQFIERLRPTVLLYRVVSDDFAFIRRFRENVDTRELPLVVLSARCDRADSAAAFAAGASDYVSSEADARELLARLHYHSAAYAQRRTLAAAHEALRESKASLLKKIGQLERLSNVDALTGLSNRRYFDDFTTMQWKLAIRERLPFSILMIDVDDFKRYNDTYGHLAGDVVLKRLAEALERSCRRPVDLVARFGGEEFVASLRAGFEGASFVAEALRRNIERLAIPHRGSSVAGSVTISVGGACAFPLQGEAYLTLLEAADAALYEAKSCGKNKAIVHLRGAVSTPSAR